MADVSYTVYARQGENGHEDGSVGMTFPPTPSLTLSEVYDLIDQLRQVAREMRFGALHGRKAM